MGKQAEITTCGQYCPEIYSSLFLHILRIEIKKRLVLTVGTKGL